MEDTSKEAYSSGIIFLNSFTYSDPKIEGKINYFVDCVDLFNHSQGWYRCPRLINTRTLCKALKKILLSNSKNTWWYFKHFYHEHSHLLSPDFIVNSKYFKKEFEELGKRIKHYINNSGGREKDNLPPLLAVLADIEIKLDQSYFESLVKEISKVVLCKEDINQHNHRQIIESCSEMMITELFAIGWTKKDVFNIFDTAMEYNKNSANKIDSTNIYKVPVPPEIYGKRRLEFNEYKQLVLEYLKASNLEDQLKNLVFIYKQSLYKRTFVFHVRNLRFSDSSELKYEDVVLSRSMAQKYITAGSRESFKEYFNEAENLSFCEVSEFSGNSEDALQKAIIKANEALNVINFNYGSQAKRASLDLAKYVMLDDISAKLFNKSQIILSEKDAEDMKDFEDMGALKNHQSVKHFLLVDKLFFSAYSQPTISAAISSLWQYCEALFFEEEDAKKMRDNLVKYYCKKASGEYAFGAHLMIQQYVDDFLGTKERYKSLSLSKEQYGALEKPGKTFPKYVSDWRAYIQHPLINDLIGKVLDASDATRQSDFADYVKYILKSAYIMRNLFQHSNVMIEEIQIVFYEVLLSLVGSLRIYIQNDLKRNPNVDSIEKLICQP